MSISVEGENDAEGGVEIKAEVEVGSSGGDKGGDEAGGVGDATGEGGADKSAAYSSSPVIILPLSLIFRAALLILRINFSQGFQNGL